MDASNIFSGISGAFWSGAFWGLTFALIGLIMFVASVGDDHLMRLLLMALIAYSIIGMVYGAWAARNALLRSKIGR